MNKKEHVPGVGCGVGSGLGSGVGTGVGANVGLGVGESVGRGVGRGVGAIFLVCWDEGMTRIGTVVVVVAQQMNQVWGPIE